MTPKQLKLLSVLNESNGLSPKQLKAKTGFHYVRKTLRTLERKGIVTQEGMLNDIKYKLTPKQ